LLAILAEVAPVGVDDRRGVVVDPAHRLLVDRHDDHHRVLLGVGRQPLGGRSRDRLGRLVPARILARAEVRAVEHLLQAEDLHALATGLVDQWQVLLDHRLADLGDRATLAVDRIGALDQPAAYGIGHGVLARLQGWEAPQLTGRDATDTRRREPRGLPSS